MLLAKYGTGTQGSIAQAIDLDGTNDYFSRASDLTGNADGKTFTFSTWVWGSDLVSNYSLYTADNSTNQVNITYGSSGFVITGKNAANSTILSASVSTALVNKTWNHILVSIDLANSSNRSIYINDVAQTVTWTTYTNDLLDWTRATHLVNTKGRLAHVFLSYAYYDLSNSTNRRLFITADRKPTSKATLQALNGIIYMPMDDPATAHVNLGTGGSFQLNGTIARSGRGPNQFNAAYSDLDGAADYLSRASDPTGIADGGILTMAFSFCADVTTTQYLYDNGYFRLFISSGNLVLNAFNASATQILGVTLITGIAVWRNYKVALSIDLADTAKRHVYVNGSAGSPTWSTYTSGSIDFTRTPHNIGASATATSFFNGRLGEVFFHTSYIDLSVAANLAKFVTGTGIDAKPADLGANGELPLGTSPLIYLPMYGNNAGKNYGTGGDFTVNSGPFTGARGPNEFFGNKADFDGSTGYLKRTGALTGATDGKTLSLSFWFMPDVTGVNEYLFSINNGSLQFEIFKNTSNQILIQGAAGSLDVTLAGTVAAGTAYFVQACFDMTDAAKRFIYVNGTLNAATWGAYNNTNFTLSNATYASVGARNTSYPFNGKQAEFFLTTEYIDFSQEANRLKFRDAFGNPCDIPAAIRAGTIQNPLVYLRFDPASQGTNAGTGGNFTKTGTIADGGQL